MNIGEVVEGRYRIVKLLGQGGMGAVFLAQDEVLDKPVAVKTLLPQALSDARSVEQLKREFSLSQELRHENICASYHFQVSGAEPFIVMEYVEGTTLSNFVFAQPEHHCDEAVFRALADQILAGIEYAHRLGVVHRDLKSGNIMVTPDGAIRIMDFGIAANLKNIYSLTTGAPLSLSVHYASPEQINGDAPNRAMDIYSLGCVFYEMLAGHPPFVQGDVLHQQLTREPAPIAGAPADLNRLILACLQKDVRKRIQSAAEMRAALGGMKTVRLKRVRTPGAARWADSGSRWIVALALTGATLLGGGGVVWWRLSRPQAPGQVQVVTPPAPEPAATEPVTAPPIGSAPIPEETGATDQSERKRLKDAAKHKEEARQKAVQEALDQCDRLRGAGDYERARAVLNNALDRSPDDARLKDALTRVRLAQMAEEHLKAKKSAGSTPAPEKQ